MMLASLDSDAGDFASAEGLYRRALKIDANLPDALNNLAYILLQRQGDLNEAKDLVTRAIALAPHDRRLSTTRWRASTKSSTIATRRRRSLPKHCDSIRRASTPTSACAGHSAPPASATRRRRNFNSSTRNSTAIRRPTTPLDASWRAFAKASPVRTQPIEARVR